MHGLQNIRWKFQIIQYRVALTRGMDQNRGAAIVDVTQAPADFDWTPDFGQATVSHTLDQNHFAFNVEFDLTLRRKVHVLSQRRAEIRVLRELGFTFQNKAIVLARRVLETMG